MSTRRRPTLRPIATVVGALTLAITACGQTTPDRVTPSPAAVAEPTAVASASAAPIARPSATQEPGPSASAGPAAAMAFPGLYAPSALSVSGDDTVAILRGDLPCSAVADILEAGEWVVTSRREAAAPDIDGGRPFMTVLTLAGADGETAMAWLAGGATCVARVARTTSASITVRGAATVSGSVPHEEPFCVTTDVDVLIALTYRPAGGPAVLLRIKAPARTGAIALPPDDVGVSVQRGPVDLPELSKILVKGFTQTDGGQFAEAYEATTPDATATLEVEALDPYVGHLRVTSFDGPRGAIDVDAEVTCHVPGGAIGRAAEAAAIAAAATPTPTIPAPSLGTIAAAPPDTLVVTGGGAEGTYRLPSSGLTCFRDPDAGAWVVSTIDDAGRSLFVSVATPESGGTGATVSLGLIVGNGTGDRIVQIDPTSAPGIATGRVTVRGGVVSMAIEGRTSAGVAVAVDLHCRP